MPPLSRGARQLQIRAANTRGYAAINVSRYTESRNKLFTIAEEVQDALATGKPVVALETTIYTHGYPYPENVALASRLESLVRVNGGVPATIGIVDGKAHVGMDSDTLLRLISTAGSKDTWKISRRDLGFIGGLGLRGRKLHGGTTIAGTMILAHLAGIKIFATGGLGGVHRGGENSMDISADLTELGRTPVAVVSSGCKSFLDIPRTLEFLETQGVGVGTFADGRTGHVDFPAFFSRDSGVRSPQIVQDEADAAAIVHAQFSLPVHSGILFANPVPAEAGMAKEDIDAVITQAVAEADEKGISGSANTPYILSRIRELSKGASVIANRALIESNVIRGTKVAVELAKLELQHEDGAPHGTVHRDHYRHTHAGQSPSVDPQLLAQSQTSVSQGVKEDGSQGANIADLLVAGSLASDTMCDYSPFDSDSLRTTPTPHTSNPAKISQSAGGVGRNVALAAHLAGARVAFASAVADDIAGESLIQQIKSTGIDTSFIQQLKGTDGARTAQYVAVNDTRKDLVLAMADMSILERPELASLKLWTSILTTTQPKWMVIDGNWSVPILSSMLQATRTCQIPTAFEPVSTAKATRIFSSLNAVITDMSVVPNHVINLTTPNTHELRSMHQAAQDAGLFQTDPWWQTINLFNLSSSGSRERFVSIVGADLTNQGVPQQAVQLLPYIPNIVTKLGSRGVLLVNLLKKGDVRLRDPSSAKYVLSRNDAIDSDGSDSDVVGGVYMRLFPAAEEVGQEDIVSVNGVGDTLLGVLMAGLVKGHRSASASNPVRLEDLIPAAQEAAVLTLKCSEAVSPLLRRV